MDSLCSLRFDITPADDKATIRDTMKYIGNITNLFAGILIDEKDDGYSICEKIKKAKEQSERDVPFCMIHALYDGWKMPNADIVDNIYAYFVVQHASKLLTYLLNTRKSMVDGDEEYIMEVLQMILKKTDELLPEAQVDSVKFTMEL